MSTLRVDPFNIGHIPPEHYTSFNVLQGLFAPETQIIVTVPHRCEDRLLYVLDKVDELYEEKDFLITIWAGLTTVHMETPVGYERMPARNSTAWGTLIPCRDTPVVGIEAYKEYVADNYQFTTELEKLTKEYKEIVSPEGTPLGCLYNRNTGKAPFNTLAIYWDIVHKGVEEEKTILFNIFDEITKHPIIGLRGEITDDYIITTAVSSIFEKEYERMNDEYNTVRNSIERKRKELSELTMRQENYSEKLSMMSINASKKTEDIKNQIKDLKNQHKVANVKITNSGTLQVYTDPIYIHTERYGEHYIGKFRMDIGLGSTDIRLNNLDNRKHNGYWGEGTHHPHVDDTGRPCWGNIAYTVAQLQGSYQIVPLVNVLVSYLETVNLDDIAGAQIWAWGPDKDSSYDSPSASSCTWCSEVYDSEYGYYSEDIDMEFCCEDCYWDYVDEYCHECTACGAITRNGDLYTLYNTATDTSDDYCYSCYGSEGVTCQTCSTDIVWEHAIKVDDNCFCGDACADEYVEEHYERCVVCEELVTKDDAIYVTRDNGEVQAYCSVDCQEEHAMEEV